MTQHFCIRAIDHEERSILKRSPEGRWIGSGRTLWPVLDSHLSCKLCKHRLTCLIEPECDRTFESK